MPFDFASCGGLCQPGPILHAAHPGYRPTRRLRMGSARVGRPHRDPHRLRHLSWRWADGGSESSGVERRARLLPELEADSRTGLSHRTLSWRPRPGHLSPRAQNRNRKDEYASQWGISIQQELPGHILGSAGYTGNKGTDLQTITYANVADPATGRIPYPQYGQVQYRTNDSNSTFHALELSARRTMRAGLLVSANYMWSHAINDGSLGGGETDAIYTGKCLLPRLRACIERIRHPAFLYAELGL